MTISELYWYWFYRFYRLFEATFQPFWSEYKAVFFITLLENAFLIGLFGVFSFLTGQPKPFGSHTFVVIAVTGGLVGLFNYLYFLSKEGWKQRLLKYDRLPKRKNLIGLIVFWLLNISLLGFVVLARYLDSRTK